jgi:hypothetical protein
LKCSLVNAFSWSLRDIDQTDIESLIPFVFHYPKWREKNFNKNGKPKQRTLAYADEVDWL